MRRQRRWRVSAETVYEEWDARNKASQESTPEWVSFAEHSRRALASTYRALDLSGEPDADVATLLASVADWPLWPDVRAHGRDCAPATGWACCRTSTTTCSLARGWRRWWIRPMC